MRHHGLPPGIVRRLMGTLRAVEVQAEAAVAAWALPYTPTAEEQLAAVKRTVGGTSSSSPWSPPLLPQLEMRQPPAPGGRQPNASLEAATAAGRPRHDSVTNLTVRQRRSEMGRHHHIEQHGVEAGGWTPLQAGCNMLLGEVAFWTCVQPDLLQRQPTHIVLRSLGLQALPTWFEDLPFAVESLDLTDNALAVFPPEIIQLRSLRILVLGSNYLTSIPSSINQLASTLEGIDIGYNKLEAIPGALGDLRELLYLHMMYNHLRELPASLNNLSKLQEIVANNNELSQLPEACLGMTSLTLLQLDYNKISFIGHQVGSMTLLQELSMRSNQVVSLPRELGLLRSLRVLHLDQNRLTEFPESVVNDLRDSELRYSRLTNLGLSFNALTGLPDVVASVFTQLKMLNMIGNRLTAVPRGITQLPALEGLFLDGNRITGLPMSLYQLTALRVLRIVNNQIQCVPTAVSANLLANTLKLVQLQ